MGCLVYCIIDFNREQRMLIEEEEYGYEEDGYGETA
jgi:hypothetical protein